MEKRFGIDPKKYPEVAMCTLVVDPHIHVVCTLTTTNDGWKTTSLTATPTLFSDNMETFMRATCADTMKVVIGRPSIVSFGTEFLEALMEPDLIKGYVDRIMKYENTKFSPGWPEDWETELTDMMSDIHHVCTEFVDRILDIFEGSVRAMTTCFAETIVKQFESAEPINVGCEVDAWLEGHGFKTSRDRIMERETADCSKASNPFAEILKGTKYEGWTFGELQTVVDPSGHKYTMADDEYWEMTAICAYSTR